jgi:hypothetical protein
MSASELLSPPQFYHGSHGQFGPGDEIKSAREAGVQSSYNQLNPEAEGYAYASSSSDTANFYARSAAIEAGVMPKNGQTAHVYAVQPMGEYEDDPDADESIRTHGHFRVQHEVTI